MIHEVSCQNSIKLEYKEGNYILQLLPSAPSSKIISFCCSEAPKEKRAFLHYAFSVMKAGVLTSKRDNVSKVTSCCYQRCSPVSLAFVETHFMFHGSPGLIYYFQQFLIKVSFSGPLVTILFCCKIIDIYRNLAMWYFGYAVRCAGSLQKSRVR